MENTKESALFLKLLLIAGCLFLLTTGFKVIFDWGGVPQPLQQKILKDSSYSKTSATDSAKKITTTIIENTVNKTEPTKSLQLVI